MRHPTPHSWSAARFRLFTMRRNSDSVPREFSVVTDRHDAWTLEENVKLGSVWLIKRASGKVDCFSTVCPHLGCAVDYDAGNKRFACP